MNFFQYLKLEEIFLNIPNASINLTSVSLYGNSRNTTIRYWTTIGAQLFQRRSTVTDKARADFYRTVTIIKVGSMLVLES